MDILGFNCWTSVAPAFQSWFAVEYSPCFISVMNLDLYVRVIIYLFVIFFINAWYICSIIFVMNHGRTYSEVVAT